LKPELAVDTSISSTQEAVAQILSYLSNTILIK
jgi:hypothetical protein